MSEPKIPWIPRVDPAPGGISWNDVSTGRYRLPHPAVAALEGYRIMMAQEAVREMLLNVLREEEP